MNDQQILEMLKDILDEVDFCKEMYLTEFIRQQRLVNIVKMHFEKNKVPELGSLDDRINRYLDGVLKAI